VEAWNTWRLEVGRSLIPNLSHADLHGSDLAGADLSRTVLVQAKLNSSNITDANLVSAELEHADLTSASLAGANLSDASLIFARLNSTDLSKARLHGANLTDAQLINARLERASLLHTNLTDTILLNADLTRAILGKTIFADVDLNSVRGLETCDHWGPSTIDHRTLSRSGDLPITFLRGVGLSDRLIEYLPSIFNQAIQYYSCFISYSTKDQTFADRVHADLQDRGVRCWYAPHDIMGGKKIHEQVDEAIKIHDRFLLILSNYSMNSEWVKTEIANARQREMREGRQVLFPIALVPYDNIKQWKAFDADTGKDSAREIREYFIPDFSNWEAPDRYQKAFQRLLRGCRSRVGGN
jgi:hypothetical protein